MFNIFDPILMNTPLNYLLILFSIPILMKKKFWINDNYKINMHFNNMFIKEILLNNKIMNKTLINFFINLMNLLTIINLMNILPNMFYLSTNIMFTFNMSFLIINNFLFFNFMNNYNIFFMNLTPKNTPFYLLILINMIELLSYMIQILTLALRLMINMIMGHIIIMLMNKSSLMFIYLMMEMGIILIQSYVFMILTLLTSNNMY